MSFRSYGTNGGGLHVCSTLRAMLTENGEHVFRLAFDSEAETTRNFIFGIVVTKATVASEACAWDAVEASRRCVHLCFELCDAFPLHPGGEEHLHLQQAVQRILAVEVRLLPFTPFQRSLGMYPGVGALPVRAFRRHIPRGQREHARPEDEPRAVLLAKSALLVAVTADSAVARHTSRQRTAG